MFVNALYQPWRTVLSMINMCLTEEDRSSAYPKRQIHQANHLSPVNQAQHSSKDWMLIPDAFLTTNEIKGAPYYSDYQEHVAKYQQILDAERGKAEEGGATKSSKATKVTKPKAAKAGLVGKKRKAKSPLRLIDEPSDEGVPFEEPAHDDEEADLQRALELKPNSEKFQPLPKVQAKGKEKVVEEQATHDLLTLQFPKKKSLTKQFIFQRKHLRSMLEIKKKARLDETLVYKMKASLDQTLVYKIKARLDQTLENLKLPTEDQVILEEPASSTGTLSSLQNLDKDLSFTDQFFMKKTQEE
ncbi:hypothetical protein Tco_1055288 [Tanacetum coccineum]|uniref:Uncharacterized protein n=1 Tax=Tanacetum coccineum TaxID=301880 RepID=A0ABQ5GZ76_9ASTR